MQVSKIITANNAQKPAQLGGAADSGAVRKRSQAPLPHTCAHTLTKRAVHGLAVRSGS